MKRRTKLARTLFPDDLIEDFEGTLFHGCKWQSMASRAQYGFTPYWHNILDDDYFCVSNNPVVIEAFGQGYGFAFKIVDIPLRIAVPAPEFDNLLFLIHNGEGNIEKLRKIDPSFYETPRGDLARWGRKIWDCQQIIPEIIPPGIDAFALPSWTCDNPRSESELVILPKTLTRLEATISHIFVKYDKIAWEEGRQRLLAAAVDIDEHRDEWGHWDFPSQQLVLKEILAAA